MLLWWRLLHNNHLMSGRFHTASVIAGPKAFAETPRRRGRSRANSSLPRNSLLAGKIQGISSILASVVRIYGRNGHNNQYLTSKFPTQQNRELIGPYQGIKSTYQGSCLPDQGKVPGLGFLPGAGGKFSQRRSRARAACSAICDGNGNRPRTTVALLVEPDCCQVLVDIVAGAHLPAFDIAAIRDDAVAP